MGLVVLLAVVLGVRYFLGGDEADIELAAPDVRIALPDVDLPDVDLPDVDLPGVDTYEDGEGYEFMTRNADGSPVRYDPCEPIRYEVRVGGGPADAVEVVARGIAMVEQATGLDFEYVGTTDEMLADESWAQSLVGQPVWIGFADVLETTLLPDDHSYAGVGGSAYDQAPRLTNDGEYYSGFAVLDEDSGASPGFGPGFSVGNLLLHELGHLVGLDHVTDASQIMDGGAGIGSFRGYQDGDLEGLRRLGEGGCLG